MTFHGVADTEAQGHGRYARFMTSIAPITHDDHAEWLSLWNGYLAFYESALDCQWPIRSAHGQPAEMPAGGHENCPVMANRSAHQGFGGVGHEAAELG